MEHFGILSLVPLILFLVLAISTRQIIFSIIIAGLSGYIMYYKTGFVQPTLDALLESLTDVDTMWIVLVCMLFGSLISLLKEAKGTMAFGNYVKKYANTQKKGLFATWLMGLIIFVDDYLSILTTANTILPITDEQKTPREMMAYVINTTSAPVCVIIPISTWVVYFSGVFESQPECRTIADTGIGIYHHAMPYFFYPFLCVLFVPLVIFGIVPKMGGIKRAFKRVDQTGQLWPDSSAALNKPKPTSNVDISENTALEGKASKPKLWTFLIPMGVVIAVTLWQSDILRGIISGLVVCLIFIPARVVSFRKYCTCCFEGLQDMLYLGVLLFTLLFYRKSLLLIGLPEYVIEVAKPYMAGSLLPAITFVLVGLLCFATGSIWSMPVLTLPIVAPLAVAVGANLPLTLGAIISASIFGAQACFYSDVTVMSASACKISNVDYGLAQLPYVIIVTVVSLIMFVVAGFVL